jgi:hypothetical protein
MVTMPALAGQAAVVTGVTGFLVLALATVQRYPQVMSTGGDHGWSIGAMFDVLSAGLPGGGVAAVAPVPGHAA